MAQCGEPPIDCSFGRIIQNQELFVIASKDWAYERDGFREASGQTTLTLELKDEPTGEMFEITAVELEAFFGNICLFQQIFLKFAG